MRPGLRQRATPKESGLLEARGVFAFVGTSTIYRFIATVLPQLPTEKSRSIAHLISLGSNHIPICTR